MEGKSNIVIFDLNVIYNLNLFWFCWTQVEELQKEKEETIKAYESNRENVCSKFW